MSRPRLLRILLSALLLNAVHAIGLAAQSTPATSAESANQSVAARFVGAWRLVKYEIFRTSTGERIDSLSSDHMPGMLMYDAHGRMSAPVDRRSLPCGIGGGPYLAYYGSFTVDARVGAVTHRLESASVPYKPGDENVRTYQFEDGERRLVLTQPPQDGRAVRLTWERLR